MTTKDMIGIDVPKQTSEAAEHAENQLQAALIEAKQKKTEEIIKKQREEMKDREAKVKEYYKAFGEAVLMAIKNHKEGDPPLKFEFHFDAETTDGVVKQIKEVQEEVTETPTVSEHVFSELVARKNEVKHYNNMLAMHVVTFLENLRPITESLKTARNKLETEQELLNSKYDLVFAGIREAEEEYKHFNEAISFLRRFVRNK